MLKRLDELTLARAPIVNLSNLQDYRLTNSQKDLLGRILDSNSYQIHTYTSYSITTKASANKATNYAVFPNQYIAYASMLYDLAIELYKYISIFENLRPHAKYLYGSAEEIKNNIKLNPSLSAHFESEEDMDLFANFMDKGTSTFRLGSKALVNEKGIPRSPADCFGSAILKSINLPDVSSSIFGTLVYDLTLKPELYRQLHEAYLQNPIKSLSHELSGADTQEDETLRLAKPFILLAGISGTGKTRFIREQAKKSGQFNETYCLTSVRPDWHEPSDLLGYISRLNGPAQYVTTEVLTFIARAWATLVDNGLKVEVLQRDNQGERLYVTGTKEQLETILPFWLCLDEMNLAPVEQYFSDYLSVLETRRWTWDGQTFFYSCDPLLKPSIFSEIGDEMQLRRSLGLESVQYDLLWEQIRNYGLAIPLNLIVAGTVNMDETTHGFSRKVMDRAINMDFGAFFPNDYAHFFESRIVEKPLSYPISSHAYQEELQKTIDATGERSITFLSAINAVLKQTPFELAYRALNELLLMVINVNPQDELTLQAIWDDFLMCKVLPRLEGDTDKLSTSNGELLLDVLSDVVATHLSLIWTGPDSDASLRPDLYRQHLDEHGVSPIMISCRTQAKLKWMSDRLAQMSFTSFWP